MRMQAPSNRILIPPLEGRSATCPCLMSQPSCIGDGALKWICKDLQRAALVHCASVQGLPHGKVVP